MKQSNETQATQCASHSVFAKPAPAQVTTPPGKGSLRLNRLAIALRQELANSETPTRGCLDVMPRAGRPFVEAEAVVSTNSGFTGWLGEQSAAWGLSHGLDSRYYFQIDDLIIPNGKGGTAQIDHVVLSQFGIFVIETKNRNGSIAGLPGEWLWRQRCRGKTYYFQNPLRQNDEHIKALALWLGLRKSAFYSIVFFCGDARFDHPMPDNVRAEGVTTVVRSKNEIILAREEVVRACHQLQVCKQNGNLSATRHLRYINDLRHKQLRCFSLGCGPLVEGVPRKAVAAGTTQPLNRGPKPDLKSHFFDTQHPILKPRQT